MPRKARTLETLTRLRRLSSADFFELFERDELPIEPKAAVAKDSERVAATATLEDEVATTSPTNNLLSIAERFEGIPTSLYCSILYTDDKGSCFFYAVPFGKLSKSHDIALSFMTLLDLFKEQHDAYARGDNYLISGRTIGVLSTRKSKELLKFLSDAKVWVHINNQAPERDLNQSGRELISPVVAHLREGSEVYDKDRRVAPSHHDPIMALLRGVDALCQEYLTYLKLRFYIEIDNTKIPPQESLRAYSKFQ